MGIDLAPAGSGTLLTAVSWLQDMMLGTIAVGIATIAIAFVGFMMLDGRIDFRRGLSVIFGCFIVFGAPRLAASIQAFALSGQVTPTVAFQNVPDVAPKVLAADPPTVQKTYDPYAGASVPQ